MSNSYNISVAPDIAAVQAVVDAIRAVDVPAITGDIATVDAVADAIRAVDVPAVTADIAVVDTVVDAIRATDVPGINTNIGNIMPVILYQLTNDVLHSNDADDASAYVVATKVKEIVCAITGTLRINFELQMVKMDGDLYSRGQIYKNGVAHGTERTTLNQTGEVFTEDLAFTQADLIQLYAWSTDAARATQIVRDFRVLGIANTTFYNTMV